MAVQNQEQANLKAPGNERRHHASGPSAADLERLRDEAKTLLTEFQDKLEQTVHAFKVKAAKQVAHELPNIAGKVLERSRTEYQEIASATTEKLLSDLKAAGLQVSDETAKQIVEMRQDSFNAFIAEAKASAEKVLGEINGSLHEREQALSRDADAAVGLIRAAGDEAAAKLEAAREQMESSLLASQREKLAELATSSRNADAAMRSIEVTACEATAKLQAAREQMESSLLATHREKLAELATSSRNADAAIRSIEAAAGEATAKLQTAREQMELSLLASHQERLAQLITASVKDFEQRSETSIGAFREQLESTLTAFKQKASEQIEKDITKAAAGLLERSTMQLQRQTEEVRGRLIEELRSSGATVLEDTQRQLASFEKASSSALNQIAKAAAEKAVNEAARSVEEQAQTAINRSAELAIARIDAEQQKLQTRAELSVADHQKQLLTLSVQSIEGIQRKLDVHLEAFRGQLQSSAEAFEQKVLARAAEEFPRVAAGVMENATAQLEKKAVQVAERAKEELQTSTGSLGEKARRQLINETENSLRSLREATLDQSRAQFQQLLKEVAAASRKDFEAEAEQSFRKQCRSAQAQIDELARASLERLRQAGPQVVAAPARRSPAGQLLLVLVALIPTVLFLYLASRPVMRLKSSPPPEFLEAYPEWTSSHQDTAVNLAQAYWDWAALHLARDYPYGAQLPEQPPLTFEVEGTGFPTGVDADVARLRYWQKLRQLWHNPQSWIKVDAWNRR